MIYIKLVRTLNKLFKYYNADEVICGKTMKEHLKFSVAYWHIFTANGSNPFGMATMQRPWDGLSYMELADFGVAVKVMRLF